MKICSYLSKIHSKFILYVKFKKMTDPNKSYIFFNNVTVYFSQKKTLQGMIRINEKTYNLSESLIIHSEQR